MLGHHTMKGAGFGQGERVTGRLGAERLIETKGLENSLVHNDGSASDRLVAPVVVQDRHAGKRMQEQPVQTRGQIGQLA